MNRQPAIARNLAPQCPRAEQRNSGPASPDYQYMLPEWPGAAAGARAAVPLAPRIRCPAPRPRGVHRSHDATATNQREEFGLCCRVAPKNSNEVRS